MNGIGTGEFIERRHEIEADYRRWSEFEKSTRLASHSPVGVISSCRPATGASMFDTSMGIEEHGRRPAWPAAFGVLADVDTGAMLLSSLRSRRHCGPRDVGCAMDGPRRRPRHGADRQWAQAEFEAIAFHRMLGIELRIYDVVRATAARPQPAQHERARRPARRAREVDCRCLQVPTS